MPASTSSIGHSPMEPSQPHRILIVDDCPSELTMLSTLVRQMGYEVVSSGNSTDALTLLEKERFSIVLTDLIMDGADGLAVLEKAKTVQPDAVVILLTGYEDVRYSIDAFRQGADDYLIKPCVAEELSIRIQRNIEKMELRHRLRDSELELMRSRRMLQDTLDALPIHLAILEKDGTILSVNAPWWKFAQENGLDPDRCGPGINYLDVCSDASGDDHEVALQAADGIRKVVNGETSVFFLEYPCHSPEVKRWFILSASPFAMAGEERVVVAHTDITSRKTAEEELMSSEAKFRGWVEFSSDLIFMISRDGNILFGNHAEEFRNAGGFNQIGRIEDFRPMVAARQFKTALNSVFSERRSSTFRHQLYGSRQALSCLTTLYPIFQDDRVVSAGAICRNITPLERLEAQLVQAQKMESLGTLVAGVAHEINNPINLIMFNLPLLEKIWADMQPILEKEADVDPGKTYGGLSYEFLKDHLAQLIGDMDMAADRIAAIVKGLKDFSKRSSPSDKEPVDVNKAVRNAVNLIGATVRKAAVEMDVQLDEDLPRIHGNLRSIEQIVMNLVVNAVEAIGDRKGRICISTAFQPDGDAVRLTVTDSGPGVDPDIVEKIFDPFVTDKQDRGGTGLGLSVTYSLVKDHGGDIRCNSHPGEGAAFEIRLPVDSEKQLRRILVVDDDAPIRRMIMQSLSSVKGLQVQDAASGTEALMKIGTFMPDMLILDVLMPEMDGLEVCRVLDSEPAFAGMKVLIITGHVDHYRLNAIKDMGFTEICYKPLDPKMIRENVFRMLER